MPRISGSEFRELKLLFGGIFDQLKSGGEISRNHSLRIFQILGISENVPHRYFLFSETQVILETPEITINYVHYNDADNIDKRHVFLVETELRRARLKEKKNFR